MMRSSGYNRFGVLMGTSWPASCPRSHRLQGDFSPMITLILLQRAFCATAVGRRQDTVFLELKALLEPFGITRYFTDGWGAYERHVEAEQHTVGKANTQKIESKHINLRTRIKRLVRRTICFSKTTTMHDVVIGLFINRYEFGRSN